MSDFEIAVRDKHIESLTAERDTLQDRVRQGWEAIDALKRRVSLLESALRIAKVPHDLCENCRDPISCDGKPLCDERGRADAEAILAITKVLEVHP